MENYALGYNERSLRSSTLGTQHLYYTRSRAQSPVPPGFPLAPIIRSTSPSQDGESKSESNKENTPPKEETLKEAPAQDEKAQSIDPDQSTKESTPPSENPQEPNQE